MISTSFVPRRASRRARLAARVTRMTLRPVTVAIPSTPSGIAVSRRIVAGSMAAFGRPAAGIQVIPVDVATPTGRVRAEWVRALGVTRDDAVLFYVHGSGYALCSVATHRRLVSQLSALTGLRVLSVDYRLAPEHRFPAAADDVERAFEWLLEQGWCADQIVVAGDSAGGHLVLDLTLARLRAGRTRPAGQLLLSPVADLTFALARQREVLSSDPMISAARAGALCGHYIRDVDPLHARLRHVVATHEQLPPTLIQAGGAEILAADAHHLHRMLTASGTECALEVWPGQMHVFQALPRLVPEAAPALRRAAAFVTEALATAASQRDRRTQAIA